MKLYSYWRSSAAYRVRIALALKGVPYETVPVDLRKDGGEHLQAAYRALDPNARVPALALDDGTVLTQSSAIIAWLDETFPDPPLLPAEPLARARCRALAALVAEDIHPVQNLSVLRTIKTRYGVDNDDVRDWARVWTARGFAALEEALARPPFDPSTPFAFGAAPGLFEAVLVPQIYNARGWSLDLAPWPRLAALDAAARALPAFAAAAPERQPDAPAAARRA